jgi:hypothetical protein
LTTNADASSKASGTLPVPKNVSSSNSLISRRTERSLTKKVCDYKPHKKEKERVRLTLGGELLDYSGNVATSTADVTTFKIIINSTLSAKDATIIIKNYYLVNPLPRSEYMKMPLSRFP